MNTALDCKEADNAMFRRLRVLDRQLIKGGANKTERVQVLTNALIHEGLDRGTRIVRALETLGFDKQHAGILLSEGVQAAPDQFHWGRRVDGTYFVADLPT